MKILGIGLITAALAIGSGDANAAEQRLPAGEAPLTESLRDLNQSMLNTWAEGLINYGKSLISWRTKNTPATRKTIPHTTMGPDLKALRDDFNAKIGTVRLLFIVGPTCGGCLFGMERIDAALLADNNDPRLNTFVVHVPALGAKEEDVAPAARFLAGQYVSHYWEDTGLIGSHYQKILKLSRYCWDTWMIYGPEARWQGEMPPVPGYWIRYMHDPEGFAAKVRERLTML